MRPQLFSAGVLVFGLGILLYIIGSLFPQTYVDTVTGNPITSPGVAPVFSIPFIVGGAAMVVVSPFLGPGQLPVLAPDGFRYCVFCSNLVRADAARCDRCNGVQPRA